MPLTALRRASLQSLKTGVERGADSAAGWLGLAELQYQLRQYQVSCRRSASFCRQAQTAGLGCCCLTSVLLLAALTSTQSCIDV